MIIFTPLLGITPSLMSVSKIAFKGLFWISPWSSKHILSMPGQKLYSTHLIYTSEPYSGIVTIVAIPDDYPNCDLDVGAYQMSGYIEVNQATRLNILFTNPASVLRGRNPDPKLTDYAGNTTVVGTGVVDGIESVPMPFHEGCEVICRYIYLQTSSALPRIAFIVMEKLFQEEFKSFLVDNNSVRIQGYLNGYIRNDDRWMVQVTKATLVTSSEPAIGN